MKRKYTQKVQCWLNYAEHAKFERIKLTNGLPSGSDVIRFLINDFENDDTDIRRIKLLLERIQNSIENNQTDVSEKAQQVKTESKSNDSEVMMTMLKILITLAKVNPRALASLKGEIPDIFND